MFQPDQLQLDALLKFKDRDKFSEASWNDRGLNPSSDEMSSFLNDFFNSCADRLIHNINNNASKKQLHKILRSDLLSVNRIDYDTEESEFICDLFHELAENIGVDLGDDLDKWMYDSLFTTPFKIRNISHSTKGNETLTQLCTYCSIRLETHIMKRELGIPETDWLIVKCDFCGEFNLLTIGPGIKHLKFGDYLYIESVKMAKFTYEQAISRMEEIKSKQK